MIDNVDALITQGFRIPTALIGKKTASSIGLVKTKKLLKTNGKKSISVIHSDEVDDFLSHFGILGMHWGIRNDKQRQVNREAKAKKYEKKANSLQTKINELKNKPYSRGRIQELSLKRQTALKDAQLKRQGKLSTGQKKTLIIGGSAATLIAAYASYQLTNSGEMRRSVERGKAFLSGSKSPIFKSNPDLANPNLDANGIFEKVVKHVNPNFGSPGTKVNCRRATFAYEMRRRGHDVSATRTLNGRGQALGGIHNALSSEGENFVPGGKYGLVARLYSDAHKLDKGKTAPFANRALSFTKSFIPDKEIFPSLSKMPNGSRGEVFVRWSGGGAHSVAWEVIKGKPHIFDAQSGHMITDIKQLKAMYLGANPMAAARFGTDVISDAAITRLDNVKLNTNFLLRWLKNAA